MHAVGGAKGLYLQVSPGGAKSWVLRATVGHKRRDIGLGAYPDMGLSAAREKAREAREQIRQGRDPVAERRAAQQALRDAQARSVTFADAAKRCHTAKAQEFRNRKHKNDWINSLERYAFPVIGKMDVSDIELAHVLDVLQQNDFWSKKTETASRVRQRIESVLTWATVSGFRSGENPARWQGNLSEVLPNPSKIAKVSHHRALDWRDMPGFIARLRQREGMAARALEFAVLTAARSSEVRHATWAEVDLDERMWRVPGARIKSGKPHNVPLSDAAVGILEHVPRFEGSPYLFPAPRGGALSDMTLSQLCKRMGVDATPHGIARSSFKDWARSRTNYADEVSELALAHVNSDATRAAYARDELLDQRRQLMDQWAAFLREGLPDSEGTKVVKLRGEANQ